MTPQLKIILGSTVMFLLGSVFLEFGFEKIGWATLGVGVFGVILGPMAVE